METIEGSFGAPITKKKYIMVSPHIRYAKITDNMDIRHVKIDNKFDFENTMYPNSKDGVNKEVVYRDTLGVGSHTLTVVDG